MDRREIRRRIELLQRNDPDGAEAVIRDIAAAYGYVRAPVVLELWLMQDDPTDLERRLSGVAVAADAEAV